MQATYIKVTDDRSKGSLAVDLNVPGELGATALKVSCALRSDLLQGTIVLCSLPHHLAAVLVLGAWHAGWRVAILPPNLSIADRQLLLTKLGANLIVSEDEVEIGTNANRIECESLVLNPTNSSNNLITWIENKSESKLEYSSHIWTDTQTALVLFTSGSTGKPKGVCHSLAGVLASAERFVKHFDISATDNLLNMALLHTMSGFRCSIVVPIITGCQVNDLPIGGHIGQILEVLTREKSTVMITGPNIIRQMSMLGRKIADYTGDLRFILCTGAKLDRQDRIKLFDILNLKVIDYYGLTETGGIIIAESALNYRPTDRSIGTSCDDIMMKVVDSDGLEHNRGEGELRVYCGSLFLGYLGEQLAARQYFDTGDFVSIDNFDRVTWLYRMKTGVKSTSTEWIYPDAVDTWLRQNTSIVDAHVTVFYDSYDRAQFRAEIAGIDRLDWQAWITKIYQDLLLELGSDYRVIDWIRVGSIERSNLGKYVKSIC
jgi:acyl-coenzyme A synthetase/AMP-(fatty) acid ligase